MVECAEEQLDGLAGHSSDQLQVCAIAISCFAGQCHLARMELLSELDELSAVIDEELEVFQQKRLGWLL